MELISLYKQYFFPSWCHELTKIQSTVKWGSNVTLLSLVQSWVVNPLPLLAVWTKLTTVGHKHWERQPANMPMLAHTGQLW